MNVKKINPHRIPENSTKKAFEFIGAPDDRGVRNVGGRLGASKGPAMIRGFLGNMMVGIDGGKDAGLGATIKEGHDNLRALVCAALWRGATPIVLGGGHDYGYPHVAGVGDFLNDSPALINVDAHLDVREVTNGLITSGSPFFLALENNVIKGAEFVEFGIQEHCNYKKYADYVLDKGARILRLEETRQPGVAGNFKKLLDGFSALDKKIVVSFDLDGVSLAHAPGVSAPQSEGFTAPEFLEMARACGACDNVISIGFFECAPDLDVHNQTSRLIATAIHRYLSA